MLEHASVVRLVTEMVAVWELVSEHVSVVQ